MDLNLPYEMDTRSPLSSYILAEEAEPGELDPLMALENNEKNAQTVEGDERDFCTSYDEENKDGICEKGNQEIIEATRPVCHSMNGRITRPLQEDGINSEPDSAHQLDSERHSVSSVENADSFETGGEAFAHRDNSKSEESVSSDSSSGFRSGGYVSEDERPPEYSKVMQGVTLRY